MLDFYKGKKVLVTGHTGFKGSWLCRILVDAGAKVIMCSAMGQQAMVIESIQAGAKDFIVKPFQADRVLEAVKKVVG